MLKLLTKPRLCDRCDQGHDAEYYVTILSDSTPLDMAVCRECALLAAQMELPVRNINQKIG